ncbi:hypothetical protein WA026_022913 [Henosepilachna vigintioctopunctata]|uniref:Transposase n=1 Tax=Henosepilachna vigintioctopunctata TaxID=420089 RepID=A0AAW1TZ59_9CUCU
MQYDLDTDEPMLENSERFDITNVEDFNNIPNTSNTSGDIVPKRRHQIKKKHYCLFCKTIQANLVRHLFSKHRNEPLVKEALEGDSNKKNQIKVNQIIAHIRKQGDLSYNQTDPENIIPVYESSSRNYNRLACPMCGGYYCKHHLANHVKLRCSMKGNKCFTNIIGSAKVAGIPVLKMASPKLVKSIFPTIRDTKILKIAAQDETIILYANQLIDGYYREGTQEESNQHFNFIASKIRLLAKLLIAIREIDPNVKTLREVCSPQNYYSVVKAIKIMGDYRDGFFRAPTTASSCCTLLAHVGSCLHFEALFQKKNQDDEKCVNNFLLLMQHRQNIDITKLANDTWAASQRSRNLILPTTGEIKEFMTELMNELESVFVLLGEAFHPKTYHKMSQLCLVYIMAFNRKRPGDCEKSRIVRKWSNMATVTDEHVEKLNENEKQYALDFGRFVTQGKLNKKCSIIVHKKIIIMVDSLLSLREDPEVANILNIAISNPYLFAAPIGRKYPFYKAKQCLRIFCRSQNFEFSKFKANMLRKHLATSTSTMPYERQRIVSDFMGHSMEIHNNIYKQRQVQVDCMNIGEILFASGDLHVKQSDSTPSAPCSGNMEPQPGSSHQSASNKELYQELIDKELQYSDSDFQPSSRLELPVGAVY